MIGLKTVYRAVVPGVVALTLMSTPLQAQQSFSSPEDAAAALAAAVRSGPRGILKVLGRSADDIVSSGDEVADAGCSCHHHGTEAFPNRKAVIVTAS